MHFIIRTIFSMHVVNLFKIQKARYPHVCGPFLDIVALCTGNRYVYNVALMPRAFSMTRLVSVKGNKSYKHNQYLLPCGMHDLLRSVTKYCARSGFSELRRRACLISTDAILHVTDLGLL